MEPKEEKTTTKPKYTVSDEKKKLMIEGQILTAEEAEKYSFVIDRLEKARIQRAQKIRQFDNLSYEEDYMANLDAANSFLRPKKNDDEVRVNTGTTEKKIEVFINELLNLNLKPEIAAYDKDDNEIEELGQTIQDIVRRSNQIERDDDKKVDLIQELLTQRALYVREIYELTEVVDKKRLDPKNPYAKIAKPVKYRCHKAEKRILSGLQVYLGDISIPAYDFNKQPYICIYERMHFRNAQRIYGTWENWKYVKPGTSSSDNFGGVFDYRVSNKLEEDEVEILHYQSYPDDEYQIIINGVMMLDVNAALPWEHEGYDTTMTVLKPMRRNLAYGKPLTASAKTLQALDNETIRLLVRKMRQAIEPSIGVKSKRNKVFSRDMWAPGAVVYGVSDKDYSILTPHKGVDNGDFQMFNLIQTKVEEFIGASNLAQGMPEQGKTATEIIEIKKQAAKMLGMAFWAYIKATRDFTYLRIYNIIENFTQPIDNTYDEFSNKVIDVFQGFSIDDTELPNGKIGKKRVQFIDRDLEDTEKEELYAYEQEATEKGMPTQVVYVNVKKLRSIPIMFYVNVVSTPADSNELDKAMFNEQLIQAGNIMKMTGSQLNTDKVIDNFEKTWKVKGLFQRSAPGEMPGMAGMSGASPEEQMNPEMQEMMGKLNELESSSLDVKAGTQAPMKALVNA